MSKSAAGSIVILLALICAGWIYSRPRGADEQQIVRVLKATQSAANRKNVSRVLSAISEGYQGAGGSKKEVRLLILQAMRGSDVMVSLETPRITVKGDTAEVQVFVRASVQSETAQAIQFSSDATVILGKEDGKRLLLFPVRVWRITSVSVKTGTENYL